MKVCDPDNCETRQIVYLIPLITVFDKDQELTVTKHQCWDF